MKIASIDIETTGLDPETCQILSIGAVIEDTEKKLPFDKIPKFHIAIARDFIQGEPFALNMNKELIGLINKYNSLKNPTAVEEFQEEVDLFFTTEELASKYLNTWLRYHFGTDKITVAGKNFTGFDLKFLQKLPDWDKINIHRRAIDPASLFVDWKTDKELPSLDTCKQRAGLAGVVTHNALEDAYDVVEVLRTKY